MVPVERTTESDHRQSEQEADAPEELHGRVYLLSGEVELRKNYFLAHVWNSLLRGNAISKTYSRTGSVV
jgi:hypothetical protein